MFALELERLPAVLPSLIEGWWRDATDRPEPARLTLYCEQPGEWHSVKSYRIEPPGRRLVELAPHLKKLAVLFKVAGPLVANPVIASMAALAEAGAGRWAGGGEDEISGLEEARWAKRADRLSLFTLRRLLEEIAPRERDCWGGLMKVLTKQFHYLWLCERHAKPHLREWGSE